MFQRILISFMVLLIGCASSTQPCPQTIRVLEIPHPPAAPVAEAPAPMFGKVVCMVWHPSLEKARSIFGVVLMGQNALFIPMTTDPASYERMLNQMKRFAEPAKAELGEEGWLSWCPGGGELIPKGLDTRLY